jgi:integrase
MATVKLTPSFVKNRLQCPVDKKRVEFCDTELSGFYIEVRATSQGEGTYYLRYKNDRGKTSHLKIAKSTELTLSQARKKAKAQKAGILLEGSDPRAEVKRKKQIPTFETFIQDRYIPYVKVRKRSWETDVSLLKNRILPAFGKYSLDQITREQITVFHSLLVEKEELAYGTADRHLTLIKYIFNLSVEWEVIARSPAARVKLFKIDNKKERYLTEHELKKLVAVLQSDSNRTVCLVALFLLSTGARRNEALKAKWSEIDIEHRVWRIPSENSKSKRTRSVPLNSTALSVLAELKKPEVQERLFISPHTGEPLGHITNVWFRLRKKANLPDLRLHDLRHQYASMLVNSGRSLYEVQQVLGHQDPNVTMRYAHLSTKSLQNAANTASDYIGNLTFDPVEKNSLYRPSA